MTVTSLLFPIFARGCREEKGGNVAQKENQSQNSAGHKVFRRSIDELRINHVINGRRNQALMQSVSQ